MVRGMLERVVGDKSVGGSEARMALARAFRAIDTSTLYGFLVELLDDPSPEVVREAIGSAEELRHPVFVSALVDRLAERRTRRPARDARAADVSARNLSA